MQLSEQISQKWAPVLDHGDLPQIKDAYRRAVTALCLENTEKQYVSDKAVQSGGLLTEATPNTVLGLATATATSGAAGNPTHDDAAEFADPVLISMVRRAMPQLIAYDICGVQPMSGPTGLVFALRARFGTSDGAEALYSEADTTQSGGSGSNATTQPSLMINNSTGAAITTGAYDVAPANDTATGEGLTPANMSFSIEKISTAAGTRALAGSYSMELAQDLRAVHGLDAEGELANILSAEILAEINREVVRRIQIAAKVGATAGTTTAGIFDLDTDSNGRWMVEKFKGLMMQVEREANAIAKGTRRGKGNIILTSSDVASALQMAGVLDYAPSMSTDLNVDEASNTFAGVLNGRYRVYVDPFQATDSNGNELITVGYKGSSPMDAGIFYCPYVPLQMVRAVDSDSFQPKIAFKTRYGMIANPFAEGSTVGNGETASALAAVGTNGAHNNEYYRKVQVQNLM